MGMSKYEAIMWEEKMKERILYCLSERLNPRLSESLYNFFMKILLYIADTIFLNAEELVQDAGEDAVVRKEGHYYSDGIFQSD
ncbi:unnamed protein product [Alternaria alternata]